MKTTLTSCCLLLILAGCDDGSSNTPDSGHDHDAAIATDGGRTDAGPADGGSDAGSDAGQEADGGSLVGECEALATSLEAACAGSEPRPCIWGAYRQLCASGNTQLLVDSMRCFDGTVCRTFSDPNEAAECLTTAHESGLTATARATIQGVCEACGGSGCEAVFPSIEILPYLSDEDLAAVPTCRGDACNLDALIAACGAEPGFDLFASCGG